MTTLPGGLLHHYAALDREPSVVTEVAARDDVHMYDELLPVHCFRPVPGTTPVVDADAVVLPAARVSFDHPQVRGVAPDQFGSQPPG